MAYVKMGQIHTTLGKAIAYITRPDATEDGLFVSTNAAVIDPSDWRAIAEQMDATRSRVGVSGERAGSVLGHHVIQSFDPEEQISAEVAHRLGNDLAERITGGEYEFVVATHLDKGHVHNHIIFNAVNMETGRKFRCTKSTLRGIRGVSDELCMRAGLSVLPPPVRASGRSLAEIYVLLSGRSGKEHLRTEIDVAATRATSWQQFEAVLLQAGVEVSRRGTTLAFRDESAGRAVRDWRLGEGYTEAAIMSRLSRQCVNRVDVDESLVVRSTAKTMTIRVPGSHGELRMTVPREQVVEHGRTLRIYVPSEGRHVISNRFGKLAMTMATQELYEWFARPKEDLSREVAGRYVSPASGRVDLSSMRSWGSALGALQQLEDGINVKTEWLVKGGMDLPQSLVAARDRLDRTQIDFRAQLVALTDLLDEPGVESDAQVMVLAASLRQSERAIRTLKRDVGVLAAMDQEPTGTEQKVVEKIQARVLAKRRDQVVADEVNAERTRNGVVEEVEDQTNDRTQGDGDGSLTTTGGGSLAERIAQRAAQLKKPSKDEEQEDRGWRL